MIYKSWSNTHTHTHTICNVQEEMDYQPVDINETGMNIDVMKKLAHCLILLAEGELEEG